MRLQHLNLLLTLAQTGSLRASAETLNVTQPALTKALKQLEEEFGTMLVIRTPKGVRLTPAGKLLAARAATALRELERAREEVAWHTRDTQITVSVGLSPAAALMLATGALARFQARWPDVRVRLVNALAHKTLLQLRSGEMDLAITTLPSPNLGSDLHATRLVESPIVVVAREGHPLAAARRLADLHDATWILTGAPLGPGDPTRLVVDGSSSGQPRILLECESFSALLAVLPASNALALVPRSFFERHGPHLRLVEVPVEDGPPPDTLHLLTRVDSPLTVPAQRLLGYFVHEAQVIQQEQAQTDNRR